MTITSLRVPADHPAYAGHFPGSPVLPAVVLLDATLQALRRAGGKPGRWEVSAVKFPSSVRPGESLTLEHEALPNGSLRFEIRTGGRCVASGMLLPAKPADGSDSGEQS